LDAIEVSQHAH